MATALAPHPIHNGRYRRGRGIRNICVIAVRACPALIGKSW
jgi:hypothetical protein